jgi:hypothetical protein
VDFAAVHARLQADRADSLQFLANAIAGTDAHPKV